MILTTDVYSCSSGQLHWDVIKMNCVINYHICWSMTEQNSFIFLRIHQWKHCSSASLIWQCQSFLLSLGLELLLCVLEEFSFIVLPSASEKFSKQRKNGILNLFDFFSTFEGLCEPKSTYILVMSVQIELESHSPELWGQVWSPPGAPHF